MTSSMALPCGAMLRVLLLLCHRMVVQCQSSDTTCDTFLADMLGPVSGPVTSRSKFTCGDGAYVSQVNINWGLWIDALDIVCSNGDVSGWCGDTETVDDITESTAETGGGLTSISSFFMDGNWASDKHPCHVTFFAYTDEEEGSSSGSKLGPYGSCGRSLRSTSDWDTVDGAYSETSDCGSNAYAIGFSVQYNNEFIYSLGLQCRTITAACPVPYGLVVPYTLPSEEPTMEMGGDCSKYACAKGFCCSDDRICGATASFCRDGLCCRARDDSEECIPGSNQCIIEGEAENHWYEIPIFIEISTAIGLTITLGGASYAVYRHFRGGEKVTDDD